MEHFKILGLLAVAAAALMAFAGVASATVTSPSGTPYGGEIVASSSNTSLYGSVQIACSSSTIKTTLSSAGATGGSITSLSFTGCGKDTVSVLKNGTISIASNGSVTVNGAEVTTQLHRTVLGFPITTHCIFGTNNTIIGTLAEGVAPAGFLIAGGPIPQVETDAPCTDYGWTGNYTVSTPSGAIVVD